jgi:Ca2+ transporting ATPase
VCVQVIIVQFGSVAFSTAALTLEQWMWCMMFGVGGLIWGQVCIATQTCYFDMKLTYQQLY